MSIVTVIVCTLVCVFGFAGLCYVVADIISHKFTSIKDVDYLGISRPAGEKGNHAVVLGGGLAGIMSARALLDHFERVTIVEADSYDKDTERIRSAVPQGAHAHILLAIANHALQKLFVGIESVFLSRGGRVSDLGTAMKWFYWGSFRIRCEMKYPFWCSSRPFLDKVVRDVFYEQFGERVNVQTRRRILSPILSTDLPDILKRQASGSSIHITGSYVNAASIDAASDEFRVVGVQVKRRPQSGSARSTTACDEEEVARTDVVTVDTTLDKLRDARKEPHPLNSASYVSDTEFWEECDEEYVIGDLVVDCTGASAVSEKWAKSRWNIDLPVTELKPGSMYVSHLFKEPEGFEADWICAPIYPVPGKSTRFGYLKRIENGLWQVTGMATANTGVDNTSLDTFVEHFSKLDDPFIYHLLTTPDPKTGLPPQPLGDEKLHAYIPRVYSRKHYELAPQWPEGLVAVGNAACVFDPVYGQGMSGVAIAALALNRVLGDKAFAGADGVAKNGFSAAYNAKLSDRIIFPWLLCVGEDLRWSKFGVLATGPNSVRNWFMKGLQFWIRQGMMLADTEPLAQSTAMGIMNMSISFTSLLKPRLVFLVFRNIVQEFFGLIKTPEQRYDELDAKRNGAWPRKIVSNEVYEAQQKERMKDE